MSLIHWTANNWTDWQGYYHGNLHKVVVHVNWQNEWACFKVPKIFLCSQIIRWGNYEWHQICLAKCTEGYLWVGSTVSIYCKFWWVHLSKHLPCFSATVPSDVTKITKNAQLRLQGELFWKNCLFIAFFKLGKCYFLKQCRFIITWLVYLGLL